MKSQKIVKFSSVITMMLVISIFLLGCDLAEPIDEYDDEFNDSEFTDDEFTDDEFLEDDLSFTDRAEPVSLNRCKLADRDDDPTIGLGFPRAETASPSLGAVSIKVLFVDFPDAPARSTTEEILTTVAPSADLFETISYGRITLEFDPVHTWYRMSQPANSYSFAEYDTHLTYIQEALALADPDTDFSTADVVYILASDGINLDASAAFSTGDGEFMIDGVELFAVNTSSEDYTDESVYKIFAHELGHSFGLIDLYEYDNEDDSHRFTGEFDLMGNVWGTAPEMMAYHRWMLNWLDDDQIYCQEESENQILLTPVETAGGLKAVIVPLSESSAVAVESRRALGYDADIYEEGALVYLIDSTFESGTGGIVVYPDLGEDNWEAPLSVGESVTVSGVTIEVLEATEEGERVSVTVSAP